ncbi:MazG nucleotide pyrophosphohydrolase domain-containing protein [Thermococcus waiotapuensis]|uniref:MazG nucleotide pyrophosphohydrolase domain-containing protein n=1 Tax=Thermococcus waiotapuensis TaxID=90909 RepID=A0AAE4T3T1_9EURY|nr:MazG nucleotide pyrophosphohydrolase domain-containing protein [Thermococcus waiotapuensis]MDV3104061.1 MazG nucleotide pyrophosphohydrolase domain-containing protein [Thermococcus waiotapuensis]
MEGQKEVDELIKSMGGYWRPFEMLAALVEEVGELADVMLALEGVKGGAGRERLEEELGDVLFALSSIANYYGINLAEALRKTVGKYRSRDLGD